MVSTEVLVCQSFSQSEVNVYSGPCNKTRCNLSILITVKIRANEALMFTPGDYGSDDSNSDSTAGGAASLKKRRLFSCLFMDTRAFLMVGIWAGRFYCAIPQQAWKTLWRNLYAPSTNISKTILL